MANQRRKNSNNVTGRYYIDDSCSACFLCTETAPGNFKMTDDDSTAYVFKQPGSENEEMLSKAAMDNCPSGSIGDER